MKLFRLMCSLLSVSAFAVVAPAATAQTIINAEVKVTLIESSYLPDYIVFQIDQDIGTCTAGTWMTYSPDHLSDPNARSSAVTGNLGVLLTALTADRNIVLHVHDTDPCRVRYIYIK